MIYSLLRALARLLLAIFYRRVDVMGLEHVTAAGPLVVVANHHNALIDAALLLATIPRRLAPVAKAPLFHHPVLGPLLRSVGAIPAHRRQEGGSDPARNAELFEQAVAGLRLGTGIVIFPEGVSHPEPMLRSLRTGSARIVLAAAEAQTAPVTVLPVGLVFYRPGAFRAGSAVVVIGSPVPTADLLAGDPDDSGDRARELTDRIAVALRELIVEVEDRETFRLLQLAERLWRDESPADAASLTTRLQRAARALRWLRVHEPDRLHAVRRAVTEYAEGLARSGINDDSLVTAYSSSAVAHYVIRETAALLLGVPLAFLGVLLHWVPYRLTGFVARRVTTDADMEATNKLVGGAAIFPLWWALEAWVVWRLAGAGAVLVLLAVLGPLGLLALGWQERLHDVRRQARGFLLFLEDRPRHGQLVASRRDLVERLRGLVALVPEPVLAEGRR